MNKINLVRNESPLSAIVTYTSDDELEGFVILNFIVGKFKKYPSLIFNFGSDYTGKRYIYISASKKLDLEDFYKELQEFIGS